MWLVFPSMSASRRGSMCCSSRVTGFWSFRACHVSWGRHICLVSCSNSFNKCWLVKRSASTSSVLACTVSNVPPGGRLSTPPGWSCILGGLAFAPACVPGWYHQSLRGQLYLQRNCRSHRRRQTDDAFST